MPKEEKLKEPPNPYYKIQVRYFFNSVTSQFPVILVVGGGSTKQKENIKTDIRKIKVSADKLLVTSLQNGAIQPRGSSTVN